MKYFLSFIFLVTSSFCSAQNNDSLKNVIKLAQSMGNDSIAFKGMLDLTDFYYFSTVDSAKVALEHIDKSLAFAKEKGLESGYLKLLSKKAAQLRRNGDYQESINCYDDLATIYSSQQLMVKQAQMLDNKGGVLVSIGKVDEALECKLEALEIFIEDGDSTDLAVCYSGIARLYISSSRKEEAIAYCHDAIRYRDKNNKKSRVGFEYHYLAICYKSLNQPDSTLYYFLKCRESSQHIKFLYNDNEAKLGELYAKQGKYSEAKEIFSSLISNFDKGKNSNRLQYYRLLYATALYNLGELDQAEQLFERVDSSNLSKRNWTWKTYGKTGYDIESHRGNYHKANQYYKIYRDYQDSIRSVDRHSRFKEIESKYNVAEKEKIITKQEVKLKNRLLIIGGLLSFLLFGGLLYASRTRSLRYQNQLSEQDRELKAKEILNLKQENKIISMQSMLEGQEEERKRIARDLHDNIGSLMTSIKMKILSIQREVESIEKINIAQELDSMVTTASQEVRRISHSMTPVAMDISGLLGAVEDLDYQLSSQGIEYRVDADDLEHITDKQLAINIFRIIQESINNTIKHAEASLVTVKARVEASTLQLEIKDNGKGFDPSLWEQSKTIGLSGIKSRIEYLNGNVTLKQEDETHYLITIPINPT